MTRQSIPDEELIRRFRAGDASAFEGVVARWEPEILRLAFRLTGDLDEARDVMQTTLMRTHATLAGFQGDARFSTWLYRVVVNVYRDRRRGAAADEHARRGAARVRPGADATTPERAAVQRETVELVARAVLTLPSDEREVVVLRHYGDLPFPEIARVLDAPATTVKSRMARGLLRLRARLKELEEELET